MTASAPLRPQGINAVDGGVRPGAADCASALNALIERAGADPIYFPPGTYNLGSTIVIRAKTRLLGWDTPRWIEEAPGVEFKANNGFSGSHMFSVSSENGIPRPTGVVVRGVTLDGNDGRVAGGILVQGNANDCAFTDINIRRVQDAGFETLYVASGDKVPQEIKCSNVYVYGCGGDGFRLGQYGAADSTFVNCGAASNNGCGWKIASNNARYLMCFADFNGEHGFHVYGENSGPQFFMPRTDRNNWHGMFVQGYTSGSLGSPSPAGNAVRILAPYLQRDGRNGDLGGGGYAGLAVIGTDVNPAPNTIVEMPITRVNRNEDGSGQYSPENGFKTSYVERFVIGGGGIVWGQTRSWDEAGNHFVDYGPGVQYQSGAPGSVTVNSRNFYGFDGTVFSDGGGFKARTSGGTDRWYLSAEGYLEGAEISDPAAPGSNKGRAYFRDNGSGKTQLVVRFPTGAIQVIATEP